MAQIELNDKQRTALFVAGCVALFAIMAFFIWKFVISDKDADGELAASESVMITIPEGESEKVADSKKSAVAAAVAARKRGSSEYERLFEEGKEDLDNAVTGGLDMANGGEVADAEDFFGTGPSSRGGGKKREMTEEEQRQSVLNDFLGTSSKPKSQSAPSQPTYSQPSYSQAPSSYGRYGGYRTQAEKDSADIAKARMMAEAMYGGMGITPGGAAAASQPEEKKEEAKPIDLNAGKTVASVQAGDPNGIISYGDEIQASGPNTGPSSSVSPVDNSQGGAIAKCAFVEGGKVQSGQRVMIRLLEDMEVGGLHIPEGTHLSGTAQIGERLNISVTGIEMGGRFYRLNLSAYDDLGYKGLYAPQTNKTRAGKSAVGDVVSSAASAAASIFGGAYAGRAAQTGINAARTASGVDQTYVNVTSGYVFYLVEDKNR